jgi:hypothetical protein
MGTGLPEHPSTLQMQVTPTIELVDKLYTQRRMKRGRGDPAAGAETQMLPVCKPARS